MTKKSSKTNTKSANAKKMKRPKRPAPGSLAWYKAEWRATSPEKRPDGGWQLCLPDAVVTGLAQLSYENSQLRRRVGALEAVLLAQMFGKVEIEGELHLMECAKRGEPEAACTCGSLSEQARTRGQDGDDEQN